jgi:hypothetical protein
MLSAVSCYNILMVQVNYHDQQAILNKVLWTAPLLYIVYVLVVTCHHLAMCCVAICKVMGFGSNVMCVQLYRAGS